MSEAAQAKADWVRRVLGVTVGPARLSAPRTLTADDAVGLTEQLRALIGRLHDAMGGDPARKTALSKRAAAAAGDIKEMKLDAAFAAIAELHAALDTPPDAGARVASAAGGGTQGAVAYAKARLTWLDARRRLVGDLDRLEQHYRDAYAEEGIGEEIGAEFRSVVTPIVTGFDESLADTLDRAISQTDLQQRAVLVDEARLILGRYQTYLGMERLLTKLDGNSFNIAIRAPLADALDGLAAALR